MIYNAKLIEKTSKDGNKYFVFEIQLTENYSITTFPTKADIEIIRLLSVMNKKQ